MIPEMRILTVRQPWAWAIIHGGKDVENRTRNLAGDYRGPVAIHAGKSYDDAAPWKVKAAFIDASHITFGAIIGVVDLVDLHSPVRDLQHFDHCQDSETGSICSAWAELDTWHLVLANPRPLSVPIPYQGGLGLRRLPGDVVEAVLAAVGEGGLTV